MEAQQAVAGSYGETACQEAPNQMIGGDGAMLAQKAYAPWSDEGLVEKTARMCHEANRVYCEIIGDDPQPRWEEAPEWQKRSAREGVVYHMKTPHASPEQSHNKWMALKLREGWRYGPKKDAELRVHPCLLPYSELPEEQRTKDLLFTAIVATMVQRGRLY